MKKFITVVFFTGSLILVSCNKDDEVGQTADGEFFTAVVDGNIDFSGGTSPDYIHANVWDEVEGLLFEVNAYEGRSPHYIMRITILGYEGPGTYTRRPDTILPVVFAIREPRSGPGSGCGTWHDESKARVVITSDDKNYVEGTFTFECADHTGTFPKKITEGRFRVKYNYVENSNY